MLADITVPDLLDSKTINSINFWYSYGHLHTGLHYDDYENILVLVKGKKRILLYPPNQSKFLYSQALPMLIT
ncbi:MAG: cupin-like domain-containing protein [Cyanobacteria bacterium J06621_8]